MVDRASVIYWDTSAILSSVFSDAHSEIAKIWVEKKAVHFISTLAFVEFCAVISRMQRKRLLTKIMTQAVFEVLDSGPWQRILSQPDLKIVNELSGKWPLRGADLWHLATAKSLRQDFPELFLLSFDSRLNQAAEGEMLIETDSS
ncbi:MAG: type II toxin-antitoxin system VapC family toxin [bacterium]|nr:type II toxin-antitoxin system VapC family toxin [bacterium]